MLKYDEVAERLQDRKLKSVAEATGLSYYTVRRVRNKEAKRISYDTIEKLSTYLTENK